MFRSRAIAVVCVVLLGVLFVGGVWLLCVDKGSSAGSRSDEAEDWAGWTTHLAPAAAGSSGDLKRSLFVPTLDTPMPSGKNVIWCLSFQIAWNRMKDDVFKEPVKIKNAEEVARRLNTAPQSEADLNSKAYYAAAGRLGETLLRIQHEMAARFPNVPTPTFQGAESDLIAYAYLAAGVKFKLAFFENYEAFHFTDSQGQKVPVGSFGIRHEDDYAYHELRRQVKVLHVARDRRTGAMSEFVLDLCQSSATAQVIVACIPRKESLAEMLAGLAQRTGSADSGGYQSNFGPNEVVLVPNIFFDIEHHFKELEGPDKLVLSPGFGGYYMSTAIQRIRFKLDRGGAELASEAKIMVKPEPRYFIFDRPFLILMRTRGKEHPFFVMWVDNAELLCRR